MGKSGPNISQNAHDLARKEKIDVGEITGTGTGGQITVKDVKAFVSAKAKPAEGDTGKPADAAAAEAPAEPVAAPTQAPPAPEPPPVEPIPGVPEDLDEGRKPIVRVNQTTGSWHCPFCDRCMQATLDSCGGCGAERDGEEAVRSS